MPESILVLGKLLALCLGWELEGGKIQAVAAAMEGVVLIGQKEGKWGVLDMQVTVYQRNHMPEILMHLTNRTDAEVWWRPYAGGRVTGWSYFIDSGGGGGGRGGRSCRGAGKVPAKYEDLLLWEIKPGSSVTTPHVWRNFPQDKVGPEESWRWAFSRGMPLPLLQPPKWRYASWENQSLEV
ncbi:MAG: hypothetical protein ACPG31_06950 [Planctomycetota bacterium]